MFKCIFSLLCLALLFGYVNVYANVAVKGYSRSKLMDSLKQEKIKNERLKVQYNTLSSPDRVTWAAGKSGMVSATQYDYIHESSRVASASQQTND